jgi:spermidine synthase
LYGEIRILERADNYRYMVVNGFDQGGIYLPTGLSTYNYDDALIGIVDLYHNKPKSALIIGLGPGMMVKPLALAGVSVDVVEIDGEVVSAAREYFGYTGDAEVDDGRRFLQRSNHRWDVIFVDAFLGGSPPWQLYTREAFASYREHLEPGGVVVLNLVGSHLDPDQLPALASVAATARTVFPTVDVYPDPWEPDDSPTRNIYLAVSGRPRLKPLKAGSPAQSDTLVEALARSRPTKIAPGRVLTDDSAPLEPLVRRTTDILRSRAREYLPLSLLIE